MDMTRGNEGGQILRHSNSCNVKWKERLIMHAEICTTGRRWLRQIWSWFLNAAGRHANYANSLVFNKKNIL